MAVAKTERRGRSEGAGSQPVSSPNFQHGVLHIIGCGPGGPRTATLQALETIRRMDVILAPARQAKLFADYIGDKPVAFDPWAGFWDYDGQRFDRLTPTQAKRFPAARAKAQAKNLARLRALLEQGLDVGLLEFGNPCLFGPGQWYAEQLHPAEVVVIPGMGADAAALAALRASAMPAYDARFLVQSAPFFLTGQGVSPDMRLTNKAQGQDIWSLLASQPHSLILYMALPDSERLLKLLLTHYPGDLPCAVVYWAGEDGKQRVVRGRLDEMEAKLADEPERFMGLLVLGRFLEGRPFTAAQDRQTGGAVN
ncbi:MAG: hypothetical protein LDL11_05685 [Desulfarculus sp.]|nr:hypothetical protein [Desulfarculus sp.]